MAPEKKLKYQQATKKCVGIKISSKAPLCKVIENIRDKFAYEVDKPSKKKAKCMKKFENLCFGLIFQLMQPITFCGGFVHNMLVRQVEVEDVNRMEFNFFGESAQFTIREFGLITGLNISTQIISSPPPYSERLINTYFEGNKKIKNSLLRQVFIGLRSRDLAEPNDMLRLCLIYFFDAGLLGKESQINVDLNHFSMVEDLDYFNQYPWGRESFNMTIASLRRALDKHDGNLNNSATYSLCGCPLAFQVWGYETIPTMEDLLATKVANTFSRIVNWEAAKKYNEQSVVNMFFEINKVAEIEEVVPSNEGEKLYIANAYLSPISSQGQRTHESPIIDQYASQSPIGDIFGDQQPHHHQADNEPHYHDDAGPSYMSTEIEDLKRHVMSLEAAHRHESENNYNRHLELMGRMDKIDRLEGQFNSFSLNSRRFEDRISNDLNSFRSMAMEKFDEILNFMKMRSHPTYDGTPMTIAGATVDNEGYTMPMPMEEDVHDMPMEEDMVALVVADDVNASTVNHESQDVVFLTPSKIKSVPKRRPKQVAQKLKSPFVMSTETRDNIRNTLAFPAQFDPSRPVSDDRRQQFWAYMGSNEDELRDFNICHVQKIFFEDLLKEEE